MSTLNATLVADRLGRRVLRPGRAGVRGFAGFSAALCLAVVVSAQTGDTRLGAPLYWAWLITGLQVTGLWAAGRRHGWGWLLGASVQPPWIVYAVLTGQLGFIPGCVVSGAVQLTSFLRGPDRPTPDRRHGA